MILTYYVVFNNVVFLQRKNWNLCLREWPHNISANIIISLLKDLKLRSGWPFKYITINFNLFQYISNTFQYITIYFNTFQYISIYYKYTSKTLLKDLKPWSGWPFKNTSPTLDTHQPRCSENQGKLVLKCQGPLFSASLWIKSTLTWIYLYEIKVFCFLSPYK